MHGLYSSIHLIYGRIVPGCNHAVFGISLFVYRVHGTEKYDIHPSGFQQGYDRIQPVFQVFPKNSIRDCHTHRIDIRFDPCSVHLPHPVDVTDVYDDNSVSFPVLYVTGSDWCKAGCAVLLSYSVTGDGTVQNVCR